MNHLLSVILVFVLSVTLGHSSALSGRKSLGGPYVLSSLEEAKRIVDEAYKYSREQSLARVARPEAKVGDMLRLYKQPRRDTRNAVRSADYMGQTIRLIKEKVHLSLKGCPQPINGTDLLSEEDLEVITRVTGCSARVRRPNCLTVPNLNKFRTANSICNNLKNPFLGAGNTPFKRLLQAQYDDGVSEPIGWDRSRRFNNFLLPLVRQVSNLIVSTEDSGVRSDQEFAILVTMFGQWNDHDLTFSPFSPSIRSFSNGLECNKDCERSEPCFPIPIPPRDPRLPSRPDKCLPVFRSAPVCGTGTSAFLFGGVATKREQINALTAFLDLGQVYGSEEKLALELRDLKNPGGLLRVNDKFKDNGRELLPFAEMKVNLCATRARTLNLTRSREVPCFLAGDERVNENVALTSIHTLFMREHNRLARALQRLNPRWNSERLYQEARKIQGAYAQVIVFRDYLPHILGPAGMNMLGRYPGYNENVDPSISNVFATAAYRFAHLTIQPLVFRSDENYRENPQNPSVPLFKAFFTPWRVLEEGGIDPLLRGMMSRPAKFGNQENMMVTAIRDRLFMFVEEIAQDLASLNMQRGRDHGLPGYNAWRRLCGLSQPRNENQLSAVLKNPKLARQLLQQYGTPDNIDVWLGGVAEPFVPGARVGELFRCIISNQFQRVRQGDRLWYEKPGVFTPAQLGALQQITINRIVCDNTGITRVPRDPFRIQSRTNQLMPCNSFRSLDLNPWRNSGCGSEGEADCESENEIPLDQLSPEESLGNKVLQAPLV